MSFYHLPHPWDPGYVIPDYVMAEPPERGTFTTQWLPRGTIYPLVPDFLAKPGRRILGRNDAGLGSLGGCTLGDAASDAAAAAATAAAVAKAGADVVKDLTTTPAAPTAWDAAKPFVVVGAVGLAAYMLLRKKRK